MLPAELDAGTKSFVGGRARTQGVVLAIDLFAGTPIDEHRLDLLPRALIGEKHADAFRRKVPVAPCHQRQQHGAEIAATWRKHILIACRLVAIATTLQQTVFDQRAKPASEHVRSDVQTLLEVIEAADALEGIAQDQDAPPLAHPLKTAGDRALRAFKICALHGLGPRREIIE